MLLIKLLLIQNNHKQLLQLITKLIPTNKLVLRLPQPPHTTIIKVQWEELSLCNIFKTDIIIVISEDQTHQTDFLHHQADDPHLQDLVEDILHLQMTDSIPDWDGTDILHQNLTTTIVPSIHLEHQIQPT